jgi:hypothetical protein
MAGTQRSLVSCRGLIALMGLLACCDRRPEPENNLPSHDAVVAEARTGNVQQAGISPGMISTAASSTNAAAAPGRDYRVFRGASSKLAVRLERPSPANSALLLSVAGTYTSPEDKVLGMVVLGGKIVRKGRMPWEGLLTILDGVPNVSKVKGGLVSQNALDELRARRGSMLQGHLLVHNGHAEPYRPSPPLQRRALATFADGDWAVVESVAPVPLQTFADDLTHLGAASALNLDMGTWSEGWYRNAAGTIESLGSAHPNAARQTNWLVMVR